MSRVKLVEKGLPVSEEDQIRSQATFKRSLEISAGFSGSKKIKTEDVIDAEIQLQEHTRALSVLYSGHCAQRSLRALFSALPIAYTPELMSK